MDSTSSPKANLFLLAFVYMESKVNKKAFTFEEIDSCLKKIKIENLNDGKNYSSKDIQDFLKVLVLSEHIVSQKNEQEEMVWVSNFNKNICLDYYAESIKKVWHPYFKQLQTFQNNKLKIK